MEELEGRSVEGVRMKSAIGTGLTTSSFEEKVKQAFGALGEDCVRWSVGARKVTAVSILPTGTGVGSKGKGKVREEKEKGDDSFEDVLPMLEEVSGEVIGDFPTGRRETTNGCDGGASSSVALGPTDTFHVDLSGLSQEQIAIARLVGRDCRLDAEAEEDEYDIVAAGGSDDADKEKNALRPDTEVLASNVWEERCVRMEKTGTMDTLIDTILAYSKTDATGAGRGRGTLVPPRDCPRGVLGAPTTRPPIHNIVRNRSKWTRYTFDVPVIVGSGCVEGESPSWNDVRDGDDDARHDAQKKPIVFSVPSSRRSRARASDDFVPMTGGTNKRRRRPQPFL